MGGQLDLPLAVADVVRERNQAVMMLRDLQRHLEKVEGHSPQDKAWVAAIEAFLRDVTSPGKAVG